MKSFLIKCSGVLAVALLALLLMFSGSFASVPAANAASLNGRSIFAARGFLHRSIGSLAQPPVPTQNIAPRLTGTPSLVASSSIWAIDALNPVTFNLVDSSGASSTQVGFIAEQVQTIFPELASTTSSTSPLTSSGTLGLISPIVSAIQALSSEVQSLVATVQGFANQFTTKQLCVENSAGTPVCITGDQLSVVLSSTGQTPSNPVQISGGSFTISSSSPSLNEDTTTSTTTDTGIIAASSTPPTSPLTDTPTASSTDATTSAATSTSQ
jgi:hypothetical protein